MNNIVKLILAINIGLLLLILAVVIVHEVNGKEYGAIIVFPLEEEPTEPYVSGSFAKWMKNHSEPYPEILPSINYSSYKYHLGP